MANDEQQQQEAQGDGEYAWSAAKDDEGQIYYYNGTTHETSWDPPAEGFNPLSRDDELLGTPKGEEEVEGDVDPAGLQAQETSVDDGIPTTTPTASTEQPWTADEGRVGDWVAVRTDDGQVYYHNEVTDETTWDRPELDQADEQEQRQSQYEEEAANQGAESPIAAATKEDPEVDITMDAVSPERPPSPMTTDMDVDDTADASQQAVTREGDKNAAAAAAAENVQADPHSPLTTGDWVEYMDEDAGRPYYYNHVSQETTWDRPDEFDKLDDVAGREAADESSSTGRPGSPSVKQPDSPDMMAGGMTSDEEGEMDQKHAASVTGAQKDVTNKGKEEVDPAVKRLMEAKAALASPDAIMENEVIPNLLEVVQSDNGNPQNAVLALTQSTHGQTAVCGLIGRWLADLKSHGGGGGSGGGSTDEADQSKRFQTAADGIREVTKDVLSRMAKDSYSTRLGDQILMKDQAQVRYLNDMIESNRWRRLLIELSASNKEDALMMFALKQISEKGHHREIARRINQSEHFSVFHAMLESELSVMGKIAVSACHDRDTSISLNELVGDLRRTCTGTGYTYIYAFEVLRFLVEKAKQDSSSMEDTEKLLYDRAIRKWERLIEVLQNRMIDPSVEGEDAKTSPMFRKRRLEVALTISELYQRKRRRIMPNMNESDMPESTQALPKSEDEARLADIETAVLAFLRRYSLGTQIDDALLDSMLSSNKLGGDATNMIGQILIKRPIAIEALLGFLYKPGTRRVGSMTIRRKCAKLIARSVIAAEEEALGEARKIRSDIEHDELDEVELTRVLAQGSMLCERIENMVSFIVTVDASKKDAFELTPGEQLCSLAIKFSSVAQGVAIWTKELTKGDEFVNSASYLSISPNVMSLVRILYLKHPFTRDKACDVAFEFLRHTSDNVQSMDSIKQQSLRLLLFLCVRGEAPTILDRMTRLLQNADDVDGSLVRYFVAGLLEVLRPPFSIPFIRSFALMLKLPACVKAIKTSYFNENNKKRLQSMLNFLKTRISGDLGGRPIDTEDLALVQSVLKTYIR